MSRIILICLMCCCGTCAYGNQNTFLQNFKYGDFNIVLDVYSSVDIYTSESCKKYESGNISIKCSSFMVEDKEVFVGRVRGINKKHDIETTGLFLLEQNKINKKASFHFGEIIKNKHGIYLFTKTRLSQHKQQTDVYKIKIIDDEVNLEKINTLNDAFSNIYQTPLSIIITGNDFPLNNTGWAIEYSEDRFVELTAIGEVSEAAIQSIYRDSVN